MSELVLIPKIIVHPDKIITYNEVNWIGPRCKYPKTSENHKTESHSNDKFLNSSRSAQGIISLHAKRKLLKAVDYFLLLSNNKKVTSLFNGRLLNFKIAFITLTLPSKQIHSDNEIKSKLLNSFLIELKKIYKVKNYVWRAELQKNENIHFHILVDKFIPHQELRDRWNRICNKLGYVDRYRQEQLNFHANGFKIRNELLKTWSAEKQYKAYLRGSKIQWNSPNSTDVHSIRQIINVKNYIRKYLAKSEEENKENGNIEDDIKVQQGRIWGSNRELSNISGAKSDMDNYLKDELKQVIDSSNCYQFHDTYFSVYFVAFDRLPDFHGKLLYTMFREYLCQQFGYSFCYSIE